MPQILGIIDGILKEHLGHLEKKLARSEDCHCQPGVGAQSSPPQACQQPP